MKIKRIFRFAWEYKSLIIGIGVGAMVRPIYEGLHDEFFITAIISLFSFALFSSIIFGFFVLLGIVKREEVRT